MADFRQKPESNGYLLLPVLMLILSLSLSACGRKADPAFPDGTTYPKDYPAE